MDGSVDIAALITASGGAGGGILAVWFAMKWVERVTVERDREKTDWLNQSKEWRESADHILKLLLDRKEDSGSKT